MSTEGRLPLVPVPPDGPQFARCAVELTECGMPDASRAVVGLLADLWRRESPRSPGHRAVRKHRRAGLKLVPDLAEPLTGLDETLRAGPGCPGACAEAARHAQAAASRLEALGALETAWCFAAAAAARVPGDPLHAAAVGHLERRRERFSTAVQWLMHAARLADRTGQPRVATSALIELAGTVADLEHHSQAARLLAFAGRYARHRKLPCGEGDALLELGVLRHGLGHIAEARGYLTDAVLAYGTDARRIVRAGLIIGRCWLDEGEFASCVKLHQLLLPHVPDADAAMGAAARLGRAAAAIDREAWFEEAWNGAMRFLGQSRDSRASAAALLDLARAAGTYGLWVRAQVAAEAAVDHARAARDPSVLNAAARVAAGAALSVVPDEVARKIFPDLPADLTADTDATEPLRLDPALEPLFNAVARGLRALDSAATRSFLRRR